MKMLLHVVLGLSFLSVADGRAELRAGVSAIDITPAKLPAIIAGGFLEVQSSAITDRLHARSLVFENGGTRIALVIVDTCMMPRSLIDEAKTIASKATGIPIDRMLIAATHTHSAPAAMGCLGTRQDPNYAKWLPGKIAEGIIAAHKRLQPAKIGWGVVDDWEHTHCRRWIRRPDQLITDPFGDVSARANMHPGHESPDVTGPSGPVDPGLSVISVRTADGKPMAFFANYSMHYFGAKPVSADYYGAFARHIAQMLNQPGSEGPDFVAAMTQGTSGDQQWMDYSTARPTITMDEFAEAVARKAMEAHSKIQYRSDVPIAMTEKLLTLNYRVPDEKRLAWARPIAAKIENDLPKDKPEVYAREALILHERQKTEVKLQALRIGDLAIAAWPNEVYAISGLKLKAESPLPTTINIELANGAEGYIPPPEQHALGGYTTWPARTAGLEVQAEPKMVETLLGAVEEVAGQKRKPVPSFDGPYVKVVSASRPLHHWRLDEFVPDQRDEPGIARYLEGVPGEAFSGKLINRAPHFAGGRLRGPEIKDSDYSVELWFWNALPTNARLVTGYLFSRGPDGDQACPGDHLGLGGTHSNEGKLFIYNGNEAKVSLAGKTLLGLKQWHHVVMTRSGNQVRLYLNGSLEIEGELRVTHAANDRWFIGGRCDNFANFEGKIDEVAVYNRALSVKEAAEHFKASGMTPLQVTASSGPLSPEESRRKIHIPEGYEVQLMAAEPTVLDPVAFDWDGQGRLWVVEMADYPLGMDGNGKPGGRVVRLEDSDGDGRYDKRTVIAGDLSFPTGILTWRDGVIVTAAPEILFIQPGGEKKVLFTGFSTGNQQLRVNGLRWGMDGWVYCAAGAHHGNYNKDTRITSTLTGERIELGSRDFRFKPDTGEFDPQSGPSQFGRCRDDWGHWFGVQNSFPLWHYVLQDHCLRRNPHVIPPDPIHQLFPRNPPVYPASPAEKRFHSFDQAGRFTSACGIEIYRDNQLFNDSKTHAFTCEPFHNLVQHHVLEDDGVTFKVASTGSRSTADSTASRRYHDFVASEDRWCRPVMVRTGPDGALWIADMYRYMIEHPQWLPKEGKEELLPHYRAGDDMGRIYRVVRASARSGAFDWTKLLTTLSSSNGWIRDRAQMQLQWFNSMPALNEELNSVMGNKDPRTVAQAGWTLANLGKLDQRTCIELLGHSSPRVREQAVQMAEQLDWNRDDVPSLQEPMAKLVTDPDRKVRLQLACSLGSFSGDWVACLLATLLEEAPSGSPLAGAAMSSVLPHLERVCVRIPERGESEYNGVIGQLFRCALATANEKAMTALLSRAETRIHFAEVFAVLDEKQLSLADFAKQVTSPEAQAALAKGAALLAQTVKIVRESANKVPLSELQLLANDRGYRQELIPMLGALWNRSSSDQEPDMLHLIARLQPPDGPDFLLSNWAEQTPVMRSQIIEALLSSDAWTLALLKRVESKTIEANAIDAATRSRLLKHPKPAIQKLAAAVFADSVTAARADVLAKFKPALSLQGDAVHGKTVFAQVCASCHKLDGVGIELGPDLRSVSQHDAEKLFNSILDPSAIIEPGFMAYHCTLKSGEQLYGVVATETSHSLTMKLPGNLVRPILRSDITSLKSANLSLMPDGLEAALTPQALADVIAYLKVAR